MAALTTMGQNYFWVSKLQEHLQTRFQSGKKQNQHFELPKKSLNPNPFENLWLAPFKVYLENTVINSKPV